MSFQSIRKTVPSFVVARSSRGCARRGAVARTACALGMIVGILGPLQAAHAECGEYDKAAVFTAPTAGEAYGAAPQSVLMSVAAAPANYQWTGMTYTLDGTPHTTNVSPYSYTWPSVGAGSHTVTVTPAGLWLASSPHCPITGIPSSVMITVANGTPPTVSITSPANGGTGTAPASIAFTATATPAGGATIASVKYFSGSTQIGSATTSPYSYTWSGVAAGTYSFTAQATDSAGLVGTSSAIGYTVSNPLPSVTITAPASGSTFASGKVIGLTATATAAIGTVSSVQFYDGATLLGSGTASGSTYTYSWSGATVAAHSVTAKVTDSLGDTKTSSVVIVNVVTDAGPTVAVTSPTNGATGTAPASATLTATATPVSGDSIANVQFYENATAVGGLLTASPYTYNWTNVAAGSYTITAKATDNLGVATTSSGVTYTVSNPLPSVTITAPTSGATFVSGTVIGLTATATAAIGTVASVQFYDGATLLGSGTASGSTYSYSWSGASVAAHSVTAKVTDSLGDTKTSSVVTVNVVTDAGPTVAVTSPTTGATGTAPASVTLTATATPVSGETITSVQFYENSTPVGPLLTAAPYTYNWTSIAGGSYTITAKAIDNLGQSTVSSGVAYTVSSSAGIYYIYPDQTDAPREITRPSDSQIMWRWDGADPFGAAAPNTNPYGAGVFVYNLRFPGQIYDQENNLNYNYFRNYDPSLGRYVQSDPTGLSSGINTYAYTRGNPVGYSDPLGLFVFGTRPLSGLPISVPVPFSQTENVLHENGFFQDGTNVGFFPTGIGPDASQNLSKYQFSGPFYDDNIMRQALWNLRQTGDYIPQTGSSLYNSLNPDPWGYDVFRHNCQDFASALRREYKRIGGTTCANSFVGGICTAPSY